jgi:hypothetical protein
MTVFKSQNLKSVEMKNQIQAELLAERERLGEAEFNRRRQEWLRTSDSPLAMMWRDMAKKQKGGT